MDLDFDPYLRVGDVTVGERDVTLLRAVGRERSLNAAASSLGRSYSRAHSRLTDLEDAMGPLVERRRGGAEGGGSDLTGAARELIERYEDLADALSGTAATPHATLEGIVVDREGELVTVETPAGSIRAIATDETTEDRTDDTNGEVTSDATDDASGATVNDGESVRVRFPADAVTLHTPDAIPDEADTSARNRFGGTVCSVDEGEATASIAVDVCASAPLVVTVTRTSLELLDLEDGAPVVATVKATAARARASQSARATESA